ncbi:homocysteine s-methyltransferase [Phlyctema vagabunda]|uniref:Homocysteine s-methyltransferase n=1 Tax=Phlyctema vagabunda TaxID=108571 RepID=A0ABR4P3F0_9HELO
MTSTNRADLRKTPIQLLDGGLGTTLADVYGCSFTSSTTPLWSSSLLLTSPATLLAAQTSFARAGADLLLTDTYQASYGGFAAEGCATRDVAAAKMRSAVAIAHQAFTDSAASSHGEEGRRGSSENADGNRRASPKGKVVLGLGAYGATMVPGQEYTGKYDLSTHADLQAWHAERLRVFESVHDQVDLIAFETIPLLQEIEVLRDVMTSPPPSASTSTESESELDVLRSKRFWISCVFPNQEKARENLLPDGSSVKQLISALLSDVPAQEADGDKKKSSSSSRPRRRRRPDFVGINCTKMAKLPGLIAEFEKEIAALVPSEAGSVGLVIYPDGTNGEVYNTTTQEWEIPEPRDGQVDAEQRAQSWDERIWDVVQQTRDRGFWSEIIVGGCCKTTPPDIERLRRRIDEDTATG